MKNKFILLFITSTIAFGQTENETLNFINSKLRSCSDTFPDRSGNEISAVYSFNKAINSYDNIFITLIIGEPFENFILNPKNVVDILESKSPEGNLNLKIITKNKSIVSWFESNGNKVYSSELKLVLICPDNDVIRIKKGLKHLFELNGASFADDNLFKD